VIGAVDRWWRAGAPPERLAMLRILVGGFAMAYVLARLPHLLGLARFSAGQLEPVGLVSLLDAPLGPWLHRGMVAATALASVPFVLGYRFRIAGPLFALLLLWTLSYRNSFGMIFHTENLLVIHVALLGLVPAADAWSLDARAGRAAPGDPVSYGWVIKLMSLVTCLAYLLAGIAKVRYGGDAWTSGDILRHHVAIDAVRKELLGSTSSPLAGPLIGQTWLFAALALATMALELGAPVAMIGGKVAVVWVVGIVGFHYGVVVLMVISFPYPMSGVAFASFFRVERLGRWGIRRFQRWRSARRRR
jgi:hypothetical protein